jgi:hypothetical protein
VIDNAVLMACSGTNLGSEGSGLMFSQGREPGATKGRRPGRRRQVPRRGAMGALGGSGVVAFRGSAYGGICPASAHRLRAAVGSAEGRAFLPGTGNTSTTDMRRDLLTEADRASL